MKTTKYYATKFFEIANFIDPYNTCYLDKGDYIKSFMENSMEQNLEDLKAYIKEGYDLEEFLGNERLLKMYTNLVKAVKQ